MENSRKKKHPACPVLGEIRENFPTGNMPRMALQDLDPLWLKEGELLQCSGIMSKYMVVSEHSFLQTSQQPVSALSHL